jgi:hypothetical protein
MTPTPPPLSHTFTGAFTQAQTKTHRLHTVVVPADAIAMDLSLDYSPPHVGRFGNKLTITLFDPVGFRGEGHRGGHQHAMHLDGRTATKGFVPGRLPPGEWTVRVNAQAALDSDPPLQYRLQVNVWSGPTVEAPVVWSPAPARVLSQEPGWYRGELHTHTVHSDGQWTLAQMWEYGKELGLDFIVLTDHNTVSGLSEAAALPPDRPLFIPGMEITSFRGHALALGVDRWIDWRMAPGSRTAEDWIDEVHAAGGLFAIAHPFTEGDPGCTGCNWESPLPKPGPSDRIEAIEICNEYWTAPSNDNPLCLALWRRLLTPTGGPTAIAGTDAHSRRGWGPQSPRTWVYAKELSPAAILDGVRKGHVIVSFGPWLEFSALVQNASLPGAAAGIPGSHLTADKLTLRMAWRDVPSGAKLHLMRGKGTLHSQDVSDAGEIVITAEVAEPLWYTAEIWGADGAPLAITNPIYVVPAGIA